MSLSIFSHAYMPLLASYLERSPWERALQEVSLGLRQAFSRKPVVHAVKSGRQGEAKRRNRLQGQRLEEERKRDRERMGPGYVRLFII